jgi:hypothetical protein
MQGLTRVGVAQFSLSTDLTQVLILCRVSVLQFQRISNSSWQARRTW